MALTNWQYNAIQREYDSRKLNNKHIMKQRQQNAYAKIPALKQIEEELISQSMEAARLAISGDDTAIQKLRQKKEELTACKTDLLVSNGFPADYLDPVYTCSLCKDTGYIGQEKCQCFKQAIVDLLYAQSSIKDIIKEENFDHFRYDYYSKEVRNPITGLTPYENILRVVTICQNFIHKMPQDYQNLLIYGNAGVGKTFLVNSIANELLKKGVTVLYLTSYQLFELLGRNKFDKKSEHFNQESTLDEEVIYECDVFIIDDLGTELNNSFVTSELYNCINERHLLRKSTIISTNLSPDELSASYSERICSRIMGNYTFLSLFGDDIRIIKHLSE